MADAPSAWTQFFAELKRRRVFRVVGAYLAAAFVVLQFADYLFRGLALPDWAFRLIVVVVVLGFIVAVPLAWAYDVGPGGIRRTPPADRLPAADPERPRRVRWWPVAAGLAFLAVAAGGWLVLRKREPAANPRRVVVAAFQNQTGDAALAPLSNMAADWITQGLTETGMVEVVDAPTALTVAREAKLGTAGTGEDAVRLLSRETGAGLVVSGRYYRQADSLAFVAQVVDARTGRVVRAIGPLSAPTATPVQGAERLRQRLMAELAVLLDDRLARFQALEREPPSYDAYLAYMDGLARYLANDSSAVGHFERAFALDSTFYRAALWAAQSVWVADYEERIDRYDSLLARVEKLRARLTQAEQHQLDFNRALRAGDLRAGYAAARLRLEASPGSDDALRELAINSYRVMRLREASRLYARLDPDHGLLRGDVSYWTYVGWVRHLLRDFEGELRTAAERARRYPESPYPDLRRLQALAALGRTDEVRPLASRLAERMPSEATLPYVIAAHELAAHGRQSDALALARVGLTRCDTAAPTPDQLRAGVPLHCADLLGFLGRGREADAFLGRIDPPPTLRVSYLMASGVAAARLGERARALALSDSLARMPIRTFGDVMQRPGIEYGRAAIAAALGDRDDALRRLGLWRTKGDWRPDQLHSDPVFIAYFSDPRFRRLLASED